MELDAQEQYILEQLADGFLLAEIAQELGVKRTTLYMRFQRDDAKRDAYTRAREEGLLARGERLRTLSQSTLPLLASGGIDPAAVSQLKLQIETEKWTLGKLLGSVFGDRVTQDVTAKVEDVTPNKDDLARRIMFLLAERLTQNGKT